MLSYQHKGSTQTLNDALNEYYASRVALLASRGMTNDARSFFESHDVAHVVFG